MKKTTLALTMFMAGGAFVAGVAVGKTPPKAPTFVSYEEMKWDDLGGPKMANASGDYKKGPYAGLFKIPAGFTSPMHTHTGEYEAIQVIGTSSHWVEGEDGKAAKKMTPGSYWKIPSKLPHVSSCAAGTDCVILLMQKTKFDYKETAPAAGSAAGSAAKPAAGSAAKPAAGSAAGSAAKK
jgi:quercetin dioxygenase-like cupin family protein